MSNFTYLASKCAKGRKMTKKVSPKGVKITKSPVIQQLPTSYTKEYLKYHDEEIPTPHKIRDCEHLQAISDKLPNYHAGMSLGLIIGANCPKVLKPRSYPA